MYVYCSQTFFWSGQRRRDFVQNQPFTLIFSRRYQALAAGRLLRWNHALRDFLTLGPIWCQVYARFWIESTCFCVIIVTSDIGNRLIIKYLSPNNFLLIINLKNMGSSFVFWPLKNRSFIWLGKPAPLTIFSRSDFINNIYLNINDLTPAKCGQNIPARGGQGDRLMQYNNQIWF